MVPDVVLTFSYYEVLCKKEYTDISCILQVHQFRRIDTTCKVLCYIITKETIVE